MDTLACRHNPKPGTGWLTLLVRFAAVVCHICAGHHYVGVDFTRGICGVSIIRSGEAMETALRECCQGVKVGKILVHRCVM
jgi:uracil phosphoribosyltransferase